MSELADLRRKAQSWGGDIREITASEFNQPDVSKAPFVSYSLGVRWHKKEIVYTNRNCVFWMDVIHEMGHVFATTQPPNVCDEIKFFGWEYVLAGTVGSALAWLAEQRHYGTGGQFELMPVEELNGPQLLAFIQQRVEAAQSHGLLGPRHGLRTLR